MEKIPPILRKPTGAIQISNVFTFVERKLQNTLMYHAQTENGLSEEEQDIGMDEVYEALGWPRSKNDEEIKACLRTLIGSVVEWNEFGKDNSTTWTACTFLASGKIAGCDQIERIHFIRIAIVELLSSS